jgi:spermidine synthase
VGLCKERLPSFHAEAFDDPRTDLVFSDRREWLEAQPDGVLDVIIIDLSAPREGSPALKLFTREMFELAQVKLAQAGMMAVQSGPAGLQGHLMADLNATLRAVFPRVVPYTAFVPSFRDLCGLHVAGSVGLTWPGPGGAATRLQERGLTGLKWLGAEYFASLPCLPKFLEARLTQEGKVLTDARPFGTRPGESTFY